MLSSFESLVKPAVEGAMATHGVPGVVVAASRDGSIVDQLVVGADAAGRSLDARALFPVASVTKLATALAVLTLVDDHALALDDELGQFIPEAKAARPGVTLRR